MKWLSAWYEALSRRRAFRVRRRPPPRALDRPDQTAPENVLDEREERELFNHCLRKAAEAYRFGVLDRYDTVAVMACAIDIRMKHRAKEAQARGAVGESLEVPPLQLDGPLDPDVEIITELYPEAVAFWRAGYGQLKLIK
jgi:hypothetical protein